MRGNKSIVLALKWSKLWLPSYDFCLNIWCWRADRFLQRKTYENVHRFYTNLHVCIDVYIYIYCIIVSNLYHNMFVYIYIYNIYIYIQISWNNTTLSQWIPYQEAEMISGWHVIDLSWWCDVSVPSDWAKLKSLFWTWKSTRPGCQVYNQALLG